MFVELFEPLFGPQHRLPLTASSAATRDMDFNPNKQYYLATCGDDCRVKFWDIRKPNTLLHTITEHSHWSVDSPVTVAAEPCPSWIRSLLGQTGSARTWLAIDCALHSDVILFRGACPVRLIARNWLQCIRSGIPLAGALLWGNRGVSYR